MLVIKRNGSTQEFDWNKIKKVIQKTFQATGSEFTEELWEEIQDELYLKGDLIDVEEIQDQIEQTLFDCNHFKEAKAFILYREAHKNIRFIKDRIDYMNRYSLSKDNASSSSETDANANVILKNVANLDGEVYKTTNREIQRYRMEHKLKQMFPGLENNYKEDLKNHIIYVHDEASSPVVKNYCEAVSLYPLLLDGTGSMDGLNTQPPKNLNSFCGQLINLTFLLSSQCKGAVAFSEFFNFFDYFCVKEWGENYPEKELEFSDAPSCINPKTISEKIEQAFQNVVYSWNQPAGNRSYQSPFTNISYCDSNYWHALFEDFYFPDGTQPKWERVSYLQKKFMKWFNKERTKTLLTFPVESMTLLSDGEDIIDKEYKDFTAEMYAEGHSFFTYISDNPNGIASCCRLRNEIQENVFSFTNGLTGVQTGSCNVITLNLNRIVQDWERQTDVKSLTFDEQLGSIKNYLSEIVERVHKYHIAYKTLLYELEDSGMLTSSTAGYISMDKLYSTVGLNGINEMALFLGLEVSYNHKYKCLCKMVTGTISDLNRKNSTPKFRFNQEFVPAEGLSSKNYNWDKEDGYWVPEDRNLYNSYFYDAHDDTSILDKFRLHGREFTSLMDGGVGLHANLKEHLSKEQYIKLIDFALQEGTSYFTFNVPNTQCDDCKKIYKYPLIKCPECGSRNMTQWTRVIGFLKPIKSFDKYRYEEALHRTYGKLV